MPSRPCLCPPYCDRRGHEACELVGCGLPLPGDLLQVRRPGMGHPGRGNLTTGALQGGQGSSCGLV